MSVQHVNDFRALVESDTALNEQVREVMAKPGAAEALMALAVARGLEFTSEEADGVLASAELSELELDLVSGGMISAPKDPFV